jgi:outer membrane biosynthesis protein TonB
MNHTRLETYGTVAFSVAVVLASVWFFTRSTIAPPRSTPPPPPASKLSSPPPKPVAAEKPPVLAENKQPAAEKKTSPAKKKKAAPKQAGSIPAVKKETKSMADRLAERGVVVDPSSATTHLYAPSTAVMELVKTQRAGSFGGSSTFLEALKFSWPRGDRGEVNTFTWVDKYKKVRAWFPHSHQRLAHD